MRRTTTNRHHRFRPLSALLAAAALLAAMLNTSSAANAVTPVAGRLVTACETEIIGVTKSGAWELSPIRCQQVTEAQRQAAAARTTYVATHFTGYNFTGSSLAIAGGPCSGGWLNLPLVWRNSIASTVSNCYTHHFNALHLTGQSEVTSPPGGNLVSLAYQVQSVAYY